MNTSNFSCPEPPVFVWYEHPFNVSMFVLYVLLIGTALIGNALVCAAVVISPSLRQNIASYFIVSLAVSDIITACLSLPFESEMYMTFGRWYHSELLCTVWQTVHLMIVPTSMWNLVVLSIDRYKTLKNPWDRFKESPFMTKRRALIVIALVWICCMGPVIAAQMWWKFQEGGSLVYFCEGTECVANVSILYLMISNVLNFYIPMFAMCVLYYKIYQIARTQYLTRPTSAMLELKSADSPVSRPKGSRKSQALTSENRHENPAIEEQGHINVAVDVNNGPKFKRCGTMIEELDEDNDKNTTSQDMRHAVAVDERRAGKDGGNKDSNDIHEHHETENHECPENSRSIDCDKSLEDNRITEGNDQRDGSQNSEEKSIEKDIPQNEEPQQQDNQSRVKLPQEIPFVPLSEPVVNEDHENEKNSDPGQTLGQEDDCKKDDIAEDGNGDNNNDDDDVDNDVDKKMKSEASMGPSHNDSTETHSRRDVSPEMQEDTSKMPLQDVLELDPGTTSTNIDSVNANNKSMTDYKTHHAGHRISYEMHDYLRRKLSGEYKMKYASRESIESTCTLQSNLPDYRNSTLTINMQTSRENINAFGSMENITKRRKIFVKNKKAARTIAIIVAAFLVCWLPITTMSVVLNLCIVTNCFPKNDVSTIAITRRIITFIAYVSCAINPFVYSYRNLHFRNSYRKMLRKLCP